MGFELIDIFCHITHHSLCMLYHIGIIILMGLLYKSKDEHSVINVDKKSIKSPVETE